MVPEAMRRDIISTDGRRVATLSLPGGQIQLELGWQVALLSSLSSLFGGHLRVGEADLLLRGSWSTERSGE